MVGWTHRKAVATKKSARYSRDLLLGCVGFLLQEHHGFGLYGFSSFQLIEVQA